ncbi:aspartate/glutamate racemase family protein [Burkholderia sp. RF2-non_BP3]|uniref:aspartate/glutamate racemase family protein n=1 Tax=Burkholderia sp. RF2-non_BP3 TaxID=1637844 RepID=UPI0007C68D31|nr:amino acid racemase [Burkholderia sp. RF2-non_BP3]
MQNSSGLPELIIGVLGGMGPLADIDFVNKLVSATPVVHEREYLRVLLDSNPKIPDRQRSIAAMSERMLSADANPGPVLADMARHLEHAGATLLIMASNTAHAFEAYIRAAVSIPFVSIIEEACDAASRLTEPSRRVGILATSGCLETCLYQRAMRRLDCEPILLTDHRQECLMQLIHHIKLGRATDRSREQMRLLAESLVDAGADVVIAGCTEIPLTLSGLPLSRPMIDATDNLARRVVRYARHLEPLPARSLPRAGGTCESRAS